MFQSTTYIPWLATCLSDIHNHLSLCEYMLVFARQPNCLIEPFLEHMPVLHQLMIV